MFDSSRSVELAEGYRWCVDLDLEKFLDPASYCPRVHESDSLPDMASLVARKKGSQLYYYVVESARAGGKPSIVHQSYLGSAGAATLGPGQLFTQGRYYLPSLSTT